MYKQLVIATISSFLMLSHYYLIIYSYAWHEHLGIGDEQAVARYKENPKDFGIINWENEVQSKMDIINVECPDFTPALYCYNLVIEAQNDCLAHLFMSICKEYLSGPYIR